MPVEIFDDDARLRNGLSARMVAQDRKFPDAPQLLQRRAFGRIAEIDKVRRERDPVLIERDQRLPAERRQGVKMQRQRHGGSRYWLQACYRTNLRRARRHLIRNYFEAGSTMPVVSGR